jgi:hypothetical protein
MEGDSEDKIILKDGGYQTSIFTIVLNAKFIGIPAFWAIRRNDLLGSLFFVQSQ